GQMNFFESFTAADDAADTQTVVQLPSTAPWTAHERLQFEKDALGMYVSSHPLDEHADDMARFATIRIADITEVAADVPVVIGGLLTRVRPTFVKNGRSAGQKMAMITIEDKSGSIDG